MRRFALYRRLLFLDPTGLLLEDLLVKRVTARPDIPALPTGWVAQDEYFRGDFPCLHEHLCCGQWEDGKARTPSTLLLFCEEGLWKACLNNRAEGLVAFVTAPDQAGLMKAVEEGLEAGTLDWRKAGKNRK